MEEGGRPRTLVIVNPASAGGRTARHWETLQRALLAEGVDHEVHHTAAPLEAVDITRRAVADGFQRIVAVGGDGTLNEVVNGLLPGVDGSARAALAVLPSGTGGDFRRSLGLPAGPTHLAAILRRNRTISIDAGIVAFDDRNTPHRYFVNIADCGVGGEVAARISHHSRKGGGLRGTAIFLAISLSVLATYGGRRVRLALDERVHELDVQNVVVANGQWFGGGMRIAPRASLDDGRFDVVVLPAQGRPRTLAAVPSVYRGRHLHRRGVLHQRARQVRIEPVGGATLLFDIEGEQIGAAPASLRCLPAALRVVVP